MYKQWTLDADQRTLVHRIPSCFGTILIIAIVRCSSQRLVTVLHADSHFPWGKFASKATGSFQTCHALTIHKQVHGTSMNWSVSIHRISSYLFYLRPDKHNLEKTLWTRRTSWRCSLDFSWSQMSARPRLTVLPLNSEHWHLSDKSLTDTSDTLADCLGDYQVTNLKFTN